MASDVGEIPLAPENKIGILAGAQPLIDWLAQHTAQKQAAEASWSKDKRHHDVAKTAEAISLILSLKENEEKLQKIESIGLRWTDREGGMTFNEQGQQVPQAILLLIRLESKEPLILITGPDWTNLAHASAFRAHGKGVKLGPEIVLVERDKNPNEFRNFAIMACEQLKSSTLYGTPHQRQLPNVSFRDLAREALARIGKTQ